MIFHRKKGMLWLLPAAAALTFALSSITALAGSTGLGAADLTYSQGPGAAQADGNQDPQSQPVQETGAALPKLHYSVYLYGRGWQDPGASGALVQAPSGSFITAVRASLGDVPQGSQAGLACQVNLSGYGWMDWAENGTETGKADGTMPLEAIRMKLTGKDGSAYDLHYRVFQNGSWTAWAKNGETAGQEGAGLRLDGLQAGITARGAEPPSPSGWTVDPSRPMVALTFDDGPRASVTSRILDSLQASGGRATFFMVGRNIDGNEGLLQRMAAQGCETANHTHDHQYISKISGAAMESQVASTNQKIQAACGVQPVLLRPPGGFYDGPSLGVAGSMGMSAVLWSIDTRDWQHRDPQKTIDAVLSQVRDGDIILLHDLYPATADAAAVLIPELTARGYQLVTVSEMAGCRGGLVPGQIYTSFRP